MYQSIEQLYLEGLFWKRLGRHERAYRYFTEVTDRAPQMGCAWTERMESAAIWMGSLTLVREMYERMIECVKPDDGAYKASLEQAVVFAPDAKCFKAGLNRILDSNLKLDIVENIDAMCRELAGKGLNEALSDKEDDNFFTLLFFQYHLDIACQQVESPPGIKAIHSQIVATCQMPGFDTDKQVHLHNTEFFLNKCHQQMKGMAESHGSVIPKDEAYSLNERIRILELLDREYSPNDPIIINRIGSSYKSLQAYDKAIAAFDRAFAIEKRPKPLINKAQVLRMIAWHAFNLQGNFSDAANYYQEALAALDEAGIMTLDEGDATLIAEVKKDLVILIETIDSGSIPEFPTQMFRDISKRQRALADKYDLQWRKKGNNTRYIAKHIMEHFNLNVKKQASKCVREMLEDFCPWFIAMTLLELNQHAPPLLLALVSLAQDSKSGVIALDAQESLALYILLGGNDIHSCASIASKLAKQSQTELAKISAWLQTFLEGGFGQSVYYLASQKDQVPDDAPVWKYTLSDKWQLLIVLLFLIWFLLLNWIVPVMLDQIMEPDSSLIISLEKTGDYEFQANRGRHLLHLLTNVALLLLPMILMVWRLSFSYKVIYENILILVFVLPIVVITYSTIIGVWNFNININTELVKGISNRKTGSQISIKLNEIDFSKSKNNSFDGLMFVSNKNECILLPSSLFHGRDRSLIMDHIKALSAVAPVESPSTVSSIVNTSKQEPAIKPKTPDWAWIYGIFPLLFFGYIALLVADLLNKHQFDPFNEMRNRRNTFFPLLIAPIISVITQVTVALILIFGQHSAFTFFWIMWVLALLITIVTFFKIWANALR